MPPDVMDGRLKLSCWLVCLGRFSCFIAMPDKSYLSLQKTENSSLELPIEQLCVYTSFVF